MDQAPHLFVEKIRDRCKKHVVLEADMRYLLTYVAELEDQVVRDEWQRLHQNKG